MNQSQQQHEPPTHLLSDYIEMTYLSFVILVGIPSNIYILKKLMIEKKKARDNVRCNFLLLKLNLNISDIFLLTMAMGKLLWLFTYQWILGDIACRIYQFLSMFALYLSSNIVVCIAIDRLRNVLSASKMHGAHHKYLNPVKISLLFSWMAALVCSLPQLLVFQTINLTPEEDDQWIQCSDIWQIYREGYGLPAPEIFMSTYVQNFYNISHLIIVFWGPLVILVGSYVVIATRLLQYSIQGVHQQEVPTPRNTSVTKIDTTIVMDTDNSFVESQDQIEKKQKKEKKNIRLIKLQYALPRHSTDKNGPNGEHAKMLGKMRTSFSGKKEDVPRLPSWRRQLRSKVFRTTLLVVAVHFSFWFPYNTLAIMKYISEPLYKHLSDNANIFKDLQILITLINPFLYGFTK